MAAIVGELSQMDDRICMLRYLRRICLLLNKLIGFCATYNSTVCGLCRDAFAIVFHGEKLVDFLEKLLQNYSMLECPLFLPFCRKFPSSTLPTLLFFFASHYSLLIDIFWFSSIDFFPFFLSNTPFLTLSLSYFCFCFFFSRSFYLVFFLFSNRVGKFHRIVSYVWAFFIRNFKNVCWPRGELKLSIRRTRILGMSKLVDWSIIKFWLIDWNNPTAKKYLD